VKKRERTAEAFTKGTQSTQRKPGEIPACGGAGLKQRRRPPFAKSLRAGRMTMLVASSVVEVGKLLLQMSNLWQVERGYVGVVRMHGGVILVVVFGAVEGF
jgi:hypothetical protein